MWTESRDDSFFDFDSLEDEDSESDIGEPPDIVDSSDEEPETERPHRNDVARERRVRQHELGKVCSRAQVRESIARFEAQEVSTRSPVDSDPEDTYKEIVNELCDNIPVGTDISVLKDFLGWSHWKALMTPAMMRACGFTKPNFNLLGDRVLDPLGDDRGRSRSPRPAPARKVGTRRLRLARGITMDSGAHDNVIPRRMVRGRNNRIRPSEASRAGVHYVSATSHRIRNEGETDLKFASREGTKLSWTFQVAEVNKVLAAVSALVDTNHRVVFDKDEATGEDVSYILNKTNMDYIRMRRDRNVWVLDAFIEEDFDETDDEEQNPDEVFVGRG